MEKKKIYLRFSVISSIILFAAISRLIPHPSNFAPIGGMALFGAAYYNKKYWALIIPVLSMWLSDLIVNNVVYGQYFDHFVWFYQGCYWTYSAFVLITLVGFFILKQIKVQNIIVAALSASLIFYLVSNFGVWFSTEMAFSRLRKRDYHSLLKSRRLHVENRSDNLRQLSYGNVRLRRKLIKSGHKATLQVWFLQYRTVNRKNM
jgi:hypothetical protein